eukprot:4621707-Amphidinium_carterae.1
MRSSLRVHPIPPEEIGVFLDAMWSYFLDRFKRHITACHEFERQENGMKTAGKSVGNPVQSYTRHSSHVVNTQGAVSLNEQQVYAHVHRLRQIAAGRHTETIEARIRKDAEALCKALQWSRAEFDDFLCDP